MAYQAHATAVIDDGAQIGDGTKIWHFSHIMDGCKIGSNCIIGQNVFIAEGAVLGNRTVILVVAICILRIRILGIGPQTESEKNCSKQINFPHI